MSGYSPDAVANGFLGLAEEAETPLTNMHLQKLTFLAYGWHLSDESDVPPLIYEPAEAWRYGPVFRSLYQEFRDFGPRPIDTRARARELNYLDGSLNEVVPSVESDAEQANADAAYARDLIVWVWNRYRGFTAGDLVDYLHSEGEPWRTVRDRYPGEIPRGLHIPVPLVRQAYRRKKAELMSPVPA